MTKTASAQASGRFFKNLAFVALFSGFALEIGGGVMNNGTVLKAGIFIFLMGIPLYVVGWLLGRSRS